MEPTRDVYTETIDYIKQIEKEILFSLDNNHEEDYVTPKDINSCDILLDKLSKELYITSNLENENRVDVDANYEQNEQLLFCQSNDCKNDENNKIIPNSIYQSTKSDLSLDQHSDYRYSFYDNSNKLSIYLLHSSMIDILANGSVNILSEHANLCNENKFGSHPNLIQKESNGFILPEFIESSLVYLAEFGLNSVGLFRKSGVKSRITMLKEQIKKGKQINFDSLCVYDVADLVKTWLRDLNPHLINGRLIELFTKNKKDFCLWNLDDSHRYILWVILKFLSLVSSHSRQNQMNVHNLAICFTPSLCECETEGQILNAQKCLEYCIENHESLFYVMLNENCSNKQIKLNEHSSFINVNACAQDILDRLLYERNIIDPLISKWSIKSSSKNNDIFEMSLQFSHFLPTKNFILKRSWLSSEQNSIILNEVGDLFRSKWTLKSNGNGQTYIRNDLSIDLRGFSKKWYETTFAFIHDNHLKNLAKSFNIDSNQEQKLLISDV